MTTILTQAGVAACILAGSSGPKIEVGSIRLGSSFGYTPTETQTAFQGSTVFNTAPSNYMIVDSNTVEWRLLLNPDVGGFSFGEIGLFTPGGVLLAIKVLPTLQQKIAEPLNGWNVITANIRMVFDNAPALIRWSFFNTSIGRIMELANWSLLLQPNDPDIDSNAFIVNSKDDYGVSCLALAQDNNIWDLANYTRFVNGTVATITDGSMTYTGIETVPFMAYAAGRYVMQYTTGSQKGRVIPITSIDVTTNTLGWSSLYPEGAVGDSFRLYMSNGSYAQALAKVNSLLVGMLFDWPKDTAPVGAKPRDGRAISRTYYNKLFALIGTTYGVGDGSTTFNLPDDRGYFIRAWDGGRGIDPGRAFGSVQTDALEAHTHTYRQGTSIVGAMTSGGPDANMARTWDDGGLTGSTGGSETRPINRAYLPCIWVVTGFETGAPPSDDTTLDILVITPNPKTQGLVAGDAFDAVLSTYFPAGAASLTLLSGTLPAGVTLTAPNTTDLRLTGTPTGAGTFNSTWKVETATHTATYTLNITVSSLIVNLVSHTISTPAGLATSGPYYMLKADGTAGAVDNNSDPPSVYTTTYSGEWYVSGPIAQAEVRATLISGSAPDFGTPLNTWVPINTLRYWGILNPTVGVPKSSQISVQIRNSVSLAVLDTATITLVNNGAFAGGGGDDDAP